MEHGLPRGLLNVVDIEATCWDGQPPPGQVSEIIEIGLTVVDLDSLERVGRHRVLVRPRRSTVSAFCTELTGLTGPEVDTGLPFSAACRLLATEHRAGERPWASWGDYDQRQFTRQCRATGTAYPFGHRHTNAKAVFTDARGLRRRRAWRRPWSWPASRWRAATTAARTTPGTSPPSSSPWPAPATGPRPPRPDEPGRGLTSPDEP